MDDGDRDCTRFENVCIEAGDYRTNCLYCCHNEQWQAQDIGCKHCNESRKNPASFILKFDERDKDCTRCENLCAETGRC